MGLTGPTGLTGATGAAGTNGSIWHSGSGVPSNSFGANNDFYLDANNGNYYVKFSGFWFYQGNLTGPAGASSPTYSIGNLAFGGIVFYVEPGGQHGLVAALTDQSASTVFDITGQYYNVNERNGIYGGQLSISSMNTYNSMIAGNAMPIMELTNAYAGGGYADWYIPCKNELNLMYQNLYLAGLGGFNPAGAYWSTATYYPGFGTVAYTWVQYFGSGLQAVELQSSSQRLRLIRRF
jgi:hypothetical protein